MGIMVMAFSGVQGHVLIDVSSLIIGIIATMHPLWPWKDSTLCHTFDYRLAGQLGPDNTAVATEQRSQRRLKDAAGLQLHLKCLTT